MRLIGYQGLCHLQEHQCTTIGVSHSLSLVTLSIPEYRLQVRSGFTCKEIWGLPHMLMKIVEGSEISGAMAALREQLLASQATHPASLLKTASVMAGPR
jgi:hypothetical protein